MRRHWVEVLWAAFALVNAAVIVAVADWETIPFHLIWVSLTLLYGYRVWSARTTAILLAVVMAVTGGALAFAVVRAGEGFDEVTEVPLMAAMFIAMVWHARRRQAAVEEARRMAVTEHQMLERQRGFVRDASHELRTPITVARGHAELLRAASTDPRAIRDADVVVDELDRLSRLSERLLTLVAMEGGRLVDLRPVDVRDFVEETGRRWDGATHRSVRARVLVDGEISADVDRLRDAVDALVENAVHATGVQGSVAVEGRGRDGWFVLEVVDDGVGIDPVRLPMLFEPFSRVDAPRTRGGGGTGLGLSIVKAIAEAHGGTVEVESEPGHGATFRVVLPGLRPRRAPWARASVIAAG
ncbi:MAG: sensor histidine kinase [Actinomycetota bacterium]